MRKVVMILSTLSILSILMLGACGNAESNLENTEKEIDEAVIIVNDLIAAGEFEEAYKALDNISDDSVADEFRDKFIVVKDVLLSQEFTGKADALGNSDYVEVKCNYDTNGRIVSIEGYVPSSLMGRVTSAVVDEKMYLVNYWLNYEVVAYNPNGQIGSITGYRDSSMERKDYLIEYEYAENGKLLKAKIMDANDFYSFSYYAYDDNGRVKEIVVEDYSSEEKRVEYEYNTDSTIISEIHYRELDITRKDYINNKKYRESYDGLGNISDTQSWDIVRDIKYDDMCRILQEKTNEYEANWIYGDYYIYIEE